MLALQYLPGRVMHKSVFPRIFSGEHSVRVKMVMPKFLQSRDRAPQEDDDPPRVVHWPKWVVIVMSLAVLVGVGGYFSLPEIHRQLQERDLHRARTFLKEENLRSAQLMLQGMVEANPPAFEARRMLAEMYANTGSLQEFSAWQELVRLEPANDLNQLGFARAAVRAGMVADARSALAAVSPAGRGTAAYFRAAAGLAMLGKDRVELGKLLAQLAQLNPGDQDDQFNLAVLQLAGTDPVPAAAARARLLALARDDAWRIRATLELIRDLARRKNPKEIQQLIEAVLPRQARLAGWSDRVLGRSDTPDMFELVEYMKLQPRPAARDALELAGWMRTQGFAREALFWLDSLDPRLAKNPPLLEEKARCALQLRDWRILESQIRSGAWGALPDEMLMLAFAARVQRQNGSRAASDATWNDALALAGNSVPNLRSLVRLAGAFGWSRETDKALWQLVRLAPGERMAWQALAAGAEFEDSPERLLAVLSSWARALPGDGAVRADHVLVATLLQRTDTMTQSAARELALLDPVPPALRASQALEMWRQGRLAEAAQLAELLATEPSSSPRVALSCGIVLAEAGRNDLARRCLETAGQVRLLSAEKMLLDAAQLKLGKTKDALAR